MRANPNHPRCLNCGKKLRATRWPRPEHESKYGSYADGRFCGHTCGHHWAVRWLRRNPEMDIALKKSIINVMNKEEKP